MEKRGTLIHVDVNAYLKRVRHRNAGTRTNASVLNVSLLLVPSDSHGTQLPALVEVAVRLAGMAMAAVVLVVLVDVSLSPVAPCSDGTQTPVAVHFSLILKPLRALQPLRHNLHHYPHLHLPPAHLFFFLSLSHRIMM